MASASYATSVNSRRISDLHRMVRWLKARRDGRGFFQPDDLQLFTDLYASIEETSTHRSSFNDDTLVTFDDMISQLYITYVAFEQLQALGISTTAFLSNGKTLLPFTTKMTEILRNRAAVNASAAASAAKYASINRNLASLPKPSTTLQTSAPTPQQKLNAISAAVKKNPWMQERIPGFFFWDSDKRHPSNTFKIDQVNEWYNRIFPRGGQRKTHRKRVVHKTRSMKH